MTWLLIVIVVFLAALIGLAEKLLDIMDDVLGELKAHLERHLKERRER